jgi:DNA polymerase/3'-5' exonuclease PolX
MIPLKQADKLAHRVLEKLQPFSDRIHIAGSIRREKFEVKDIEIVCQPNYVDGAQGSFFADTVAEMVISQNYVQVIKSLGRIIKGKPDGRYMQIELPQKINVDLFMPDPVDYYRQFAIRTGSSEYSHKTIAAGWLKKGWCGSDMGLRLQSDCRIVTHYPTGKSEWHCVNPNGERPPVWNSEPEFFNWIGVPWIMPKLRTI